jgi:hypothetical protein
MMNIDETVNPYGITHGEYRKQNCYDIAAGVFPFLLSGTAFMLVEAPLHLSFIPDFLRSFILVFLCYWLLIAGVAFASWKSWPRWSYPYAGYVLIFFLYTLSLRMPGREYVLLITWLMFYVLFITILTTSRNSIPLALFFKNLWNDWTNYSFAVYGFLPLYGFLMFDEVNREYQFPYMLICTILLIAGAFLYMLSQYKWQRFLALFISLWIMNLTLALSLAYYWDGRQEFWMKQPGDGYTTFIGFLYTGVGISIIMFFPAIGGLFFSCYRWMKQ